MPFNNLSFRCEENEYGGLELNLCGNAMVD